MAQTWHTQTTFDSVSNRVAFENSLGIMQQQLQHTVAYTLGLAQSGVASEYRKAREGLFLKYGPEYTRQVSG